MKPTGKQKFIAITLAVLGVPLTIYGALYPPKKRLPEFIEAGRRDVVQAVLATGRVVAENALAIAFERGGKVVEHHSSVGKRVKRGEMLARLDGTELYNQVKEREAGRLVAQGALQQAEAGLAREQARLSELQRGARKEEIALAEIKLEGARGELENARGSLRVLQNQRARDEEQARQKETDARANASTVEEKANVDLQNLSADTSDIVNNAYTIANDAIRNQVDALFTNDSTSTPRLTFTTTNVQLRIAVENERVVIESVLNDMESDRAAKTTSEEVRDALLEKTKMRLESIRDFLYDLYRATDEAADISETVILSYQTSVNTGTTNINTTLTNINTHSQAIALQKAVNAQATTGAHTLLNDAIAAQKTLAALYDTKITAAEGDIERAQTTAATAEEELRLKRAGATKEEIRTQEARVWEQEAAVSSARAQVLSEDVLVSRARAELDKMTLTTPIDGVITADDIEIGEIVAQNAPLITIIGNTPYQLEVFIPEIDITRLEDGDAAEIALDAYGDNVMFTAKIILIDPAETILEGVATYKTTLVFEQGDERIKPGMTANIEIVTDKRENVIAIPARLVITDNAKKGVKIVTDEGPISERAVVVGLRGSDGYVEIVEGVSDGEKLVILD